MMTMILLVLAEAVVLDQVAEAMVVDPQVEATAALQEEEMGEAIAAPL